MAPTPSSRGITRSINTTSGRRRSASRTAASPSAASPTTSMPSWSSRNVRSPSRTTAWSSTTSTRIGSAIGRLQANRGPLPGARADLQAATQPPRALFHRGEPEPARAHVRRPRIEAGAVVSDLEQHAPVAPGEPHADLARLRVAHRVLERLLGDAEELAVAPPGGAILVGLQLDRHAVQPA